MSTVTVRARPSTVLASMVLGVALVAALPGAAAGRTIVVDDDGRGRVGHCDAPSKRAKSTIAAAVGEAHTGDTIAVCPGTYKEHVVVALRTITLKSIRPQQAVIRGVHGSHPDSDDSEAVILVDDVDGVRIEGFKVVALGESGILVRDSDNVSVVGNHVTHGKSKKLTTGIELDQSTGQVVDNFVLEAQNGIVASKLAGYMLIQDNSVNAQWPGVTARMEVGIKATGEAIIAGNTVAGRLSEGSAANRSSKLGTGIHLTADEGASVRHNTVLNATTGIYVTSGVAVPAPPIPVEENLVKARDTGIRIWAATNLSIRGNDVLAQTLPGNSILVENMMDTVVADNDFRGSAGADIRELSGPPPPAGHENTWTDNLADDCDPSSFC